jgi:hypothetical protein
VVLIDFLCANADIFAWSPLDMSGIPREVAEHSLDILPHSRAMQQWLRHFDKERLLTVYIRIKLHMDLQVDKSPVVVKGPFFP